MSKHRPKMSDEATARYDRAHTIIYAAQARAERAGDAGRQALYSLEDIRIVVGYAEPGYGSGEDDIIAFGNWNPCDRGRYNQDGYVSGFDLARDEPKAPEVLPSRVGTLLERAGVEVEWSDEWTECSECGRAVRIHADSYGWTRSYVDSEYGAVCEDCTGEDPAEYLEGLEDNPQTAVTLDSIDPCDHGYIHIPERFERGLYGGQAADPERIAEGLREMGITRFIFRIDSVGQFDARFSVFVHADDIPEREDGVQLANGAAAEAIAEALRSHGTDGVDPAAMMKQALANIPPASGPGIHYTKVDLGTGTAETHQVSHEDFVAGNLP